MAPAFMNAALILSACVFPSSASRIAVAGSSLNRDTADPVTNGLGEGVVNPMHTLTRATNYISDSEAPMNSLTRATEYIQDYVPIVTLNEVDARKPNFVMPEFDDIAGVRAGPLRKAGIAKDTAIALVQRFSMEGLSANPGICKTKWVNEVAPKLQAWNQGTKWVNGVAAANEAGPVSQTVKSMPLTMDFSEFSRLPGLDPNWEGKDVRKSMLPMKKSTDAVAIAAWLSKHFGYFRFFSGKTLAKDFVSGSSLDAECLSGGSDEDCFRRLVQFASLDKDVNAVLTFDEAFDALPLKALPKKVSTTLGMPDLSWTTVSNVGRSELAGLHIAPSLATSVLSMEEARNAGGWAKLDLQKTLTEFVKRGFTEGGAGLDGTLKFHQIADLFIQTNGEALAVKEGVLTEMVDGAVVSLEVPTLRDVEGTKKARNARHADPGNRRLEEQEGIRAWLVTQGVEDPYSWRGTHRTSEKARKMAEDVTQWEASHNLDFEGIAPLMALFVRLDGDRDGEITFQEAHPYLSAEIHRRDAVSASESHN